MSSSASNRTTTFTPWEYQTIALAGVTQCATLVHGLANTGTMPANEAAASINSLLTLNPGSVADVYPDLNHLNPGLIALQDIFSNEREHKHPDLVRYTLGMLVLRNKLMSNATMQEQLRTRLQGISPIIISQKNYVANFTSEASEWQSERTFEQLARLYQDTISTLSYRIQVQGKIEHLKNERIAIRMRALLLAGIRSAVLWHQLGGRRWRLIFYRKRIAGTAASIRRKLIVSV